MPQKTSADAVLSRRPGGANCRMIACTKAGGRSPAQALAIMGISKRWQIGMPRNRGSRTQKGIKRAQNGCKLPAVGIGRAANNMRQGFAIQRAQRTERLTRALSIAIPVFAYICR